MLQLTDIKKTYKTASLEQQVLKGVSLSLRESEFVAILGQSGSGKTTLLNIIGGLDRYDEGELIINGISTKKYGSRDWDSYRNHTVGFVFQSYNLIPHQTLLSNVELALTISGISKSERVRRAKEALEKVGLGEHMYKKPNQISGGQMQRVAIARALVNDPDILLADEPTGALDSDTSLQVMDLLKEVAEDRLVVMVTHNPELAEQYATRIVRLKDGRIEADSDPFEPETENSAPAVHRNMGRSSMSLFTALALSFNNLWTKKARTILVAFAGSIGIIGIAMIMSLSNGVNQYVADIESEALQNYPLSITDTSFSSTLLLAMAGGSDSIAEQTGVVTEDTGGSGKDAAPANTGNDSTGAGKGGSGSPDSDGDGTGKTEKEKPQVRELPMLSSIFSQMVTNDLASLMAFFESGESDIYDNVQTIEYDYNISPQIFLQLDSGVRQVNPDQSFSALGFSSGGTTNGLWSTFSSSDTFFALPKKSALYEDSYDLKEGRWPQNYNECVVVLTSRGFIADMCLYAMGLKDPKDLDSMVQAFADGTEIEVKASDTAYKYSDFIGKSFKVVNASDLYTYDDEYSIWVSHSTDTKFIESLMEGADDLTVVGVVQPAEGNSSPILSMGVGYPQSLIEHLVDGAAESGVVLAQLEKPEVNVLTGLPFGEEKDKGDMDLSDLFSIDMDSLANAFSFDTAGLDFDMPDMDLSDLDFSDMDFSEMDFSDVDFSDIDLSDIDLSEMDIDPENTDLLDLIPQLTEDQVQDLLKNVNFGMSRNRMRRLLTRIWDGYMEYAEHSPYTDYTELGPAVRRYLVTADARQALAGEIKAIWDENSKNFITYDDLTVIFKDLLAGYDAYFASLYPETDFTYDYLDEYLATDEARTIAQDHRDTLQKQFRDSMVNDKQMRDLMLNMLESYEDYADGHAMPVPSLILKSFGEYLETEQGREDLTAVSNAFIEAADLRADLADLFSGAMESAGGYLQDMMQPVMSSVMEQVMQKIGTVVQNNLQDTMGQLMERFGRNLSDSISESFSDAFSFDGSALTNAFQSAMSMDDLSNLMMSMFYTEDTSYESNLRKFGYADYAKPATITIYPLDFEAKTRVKEIIDDYNSRMKAAGEDSKVIAYTDAVDVLMGSVTNIINVVSYVLIAFVSISLVVSSVMIGVITYISVLERKKEIGILRAIGASKMNISQVFNAETFITGALAGLFGVGITLAAIPPINALIHNLTNQYNINAYLPLTSAGILILLSIVLTLIGGIIPSMKAAKSDPVAALRSE